MHSISSREDAITYRLTTFWVREYAQHPDTSYQSLFRTKHDHIEDCALRALHTASKGSCFGWNITILRTALCHSKHLHHTGIAHSIEGCFSKLADTLSCLKLEQLTMLESIASTLCGLSHVSYNVWK